MILSSDYVARLIIPAAGCLAIGFAYTQEGPVVEPSAEPVEELFSEAPTLEAKLEQSEEAKPVAELPRLPEPGAAATAEADVSGGAVGAVIGDAVTAEAPPELPVVSGEVAVDTSLVGPGGGDNPFDLVLKDGRILKSYQVHSWNKTTLTIFHSTGAANVPAHLLPPALVKAYGMDPNQAEKEAALGKTKRTEQAVAALKAMDERKALRNMPVVTVEGLVTTVSKDGVSLMVDDPTGIAGKGYQRIGGMIYDSAGKPVPQFRGQIFGTIWVTGHPLQGVVVDGDRLRFKGKVSGRHQVELKTYPSVRFEKAAN